MAGGRASNFPMSDELFQIEPTLSPKLRWLERHGLTVTKLPTGRYECALDDVTVATGDSEEDACLEFSLKFKLPHWSMWP
jgi:hypothetical protein